MLATLKRVAGWLWFPWLIAIYPVVFLFERNMGLVYPEDFALAMGMALLGVAGLMALFWAIFCSVPRAAVASSLVAALFFSAGHVANLMSASETGKSLALSPLNWYHLRSSLC